jgi:23S rRNA pseudouridine1911/1915/1917 synthase
MTGQTPSPHESTVYAFTAASTGDRLDRFLAQRIEDVSRTEIQRAIRAGHVTVNETPQTTPSARLSAGDAVVLQLPQIPLLTPAPVALTILHEDESILVVDKPAGLVVHPGAGTTDPTLVEGLLVDRGLPVGDDPVRPGIVHRLDKDTSGLLVVAKTQSALTELKRQFASREVIKVYLTQVTGRIVEAEGLIDAPVGRDPARPRRMAIGSDGRAARTEFTVLAREDDSTLLVVHPLTGRTHQIRVHFHYIGHPILGDSIYRGGSSSRLMLHAWRLGFTHPSTGRPVRFESPVPPQFPAHRYEEISWPEAPR